MLEAAEEDYNSSCSIGAAEYFGSTKKKKSKNNKRRFSDDQIKCLESIFKSETKLEPRKKLQLARELGLHPRQVAIWFQNKRARWKSKQLEEDYSLLRDNYNTLSSQFEILNKEKQSLLTQLQKLNDLIEKSHQKKKEGLSRELEELDDRGPIKKSELIDHVKPQTIGLRLGGGLSLSDDDCGGGINKTHNLGLKEDDPELLGVVEPADSSLTSPEEWGSLESEGLLLSNHPNTSTYQWWDFWS